MKPDEIDGLADLVPDDIEQLGERKSEEVSAASYLSVSNAGGGWVGNSPALPSCCWERDCCMSAAPPACAAGPGSCPAARVATGARRSCCCNARSCCISCQASSSSDVL